ncbi:hypothetical protein Busp01_17430 [Trinickia caryophylli]|nr:hypothetical protein Busp01_17430 [Trinickia caryophylli]
MLAQAAAFQLERGERGLRIAGGIGMGLVHVLSYENNGKQLANAFARKGLCYASARQLRNT